MSSHWKKSPLSHTEPSRATVRYAVGALRTIGVKSENAIAGLADRAGMTARRMRAVFYDDAAVVIVRHEWDRIRLYVAELLRREAAELRRRADEWEAQADALDGMQLDLWGNEQTGTAWQQISNAGRRGLGAGWRG